MPRKVPDRDLIKRNTVVGAELTEFRQAERAGWRSEQEFKAFFNQSFQFALILDMDGRVLESNDLCKTTCGPLAEGIHQRHLWEAEWWRSFPEVQEKTKVAIEAVCRGRVVSDAVHFLDKTGQTRHGVRIFSPIKNDADAIHLISVVGLDVSDKKVAERALHESERRYRFLVNNIPGTAYQLVQSATGKFRFDFIGENCIDLIGLTSEEITAHPEQIFTIIPEPDAEAVQQAIAQSAKTMTAYELDHRITKPNGETVWVHIASQPRRRPNGDIVWDGLGIDITERKMAEENRKIFENIVSSTPDKIAFLDAQYTYVYVNRSYEHYSGCSQEYFRGKTVAEYLGEEVFRSHIKPKFDKCLRGDVVKYQQWFDFPKLGRRYVAVTYSPYKDFSGAIVGVVANSRDITDQQLAQKAVLKSYAQLELRHEIASSFLTCPKRELFSRLLELILSEFASAFGYVGYIDERGNLVCPSMNHPIWEHSRVDGNNAEFPATLWGELWGRSLRNKAAMMQNKGLGLPPGHVALRNALAVPILAGDVLIGQITVANKASDYTKEDKRELSAICGFIAPMLNIYLEKEKVEEELRVYTKKLEDKNIALNVLLENREAEMDTMAASILENFEQWVLPYYEKMREIHSPDDMAALLNIVEENTQKSLSALGKSTHVGHRSFTPMEIQVADLVKLGKTSKQIAKILNISPRSVFFHRNNIRKKLDLQNKKINLHTYLTTHA